MLFLYSSAGWVGNDAIYPIIGEHDPYYHVSARVGLILVMFLASYKFSVKFGSKLEIQHSVKSLQISAGRGFPTDYESPLLCYQTLPDILIITSIFSCGLFLFRS